MKRALATVVLAAISATPSVSFAQVKPDTPPATRPAGAQADVPVKQVVLFSSGVGYFEHFGTVTGDGTTELRFKTDQINDVLKSLLLQDLDKGQVGTVSYPSQEPINKTLKSFQVDITNNPPLADLLNQLRGARIDINLGETNVKGTIVGVEKRQEPAGEKGQTVESWLLTLKVGPRFRSIALKDVRDFALEDPKLEEELDKALAALAQSRDQEKKPVTIHFRGQGDRRVRIGYVVETPIWKTSYRLVLTDAAGKRPATQPAAATTRPARKDTGGKLQGWAIVENQTDNDWNDVQLSLVSGRPISFIQDLYHPLYVPRPLIFQNLYASLRPQTYRGGISEADEQKLNETRAQNQAQNDNLLRNRAGNNIRSGGIGGGGGGLFGNNAMQQQVAQQQQPLDPTASVASAASASNLGELFEYTVGSVTLARQKSAMIPIVTDDVEVEKVSIYNAAVLASHPLNGAKVRNTTGKHLLQGPVTVLEAGSYAGDARIDDVPPGQSRLLSYGIDLNLTADPNERKEPSTIQTGKIVKGVLELTIKQVNEQTYVFQNKGDTAKTIIVEHPRSAEWKLVEPAKAEETAETVFRFRTEAEAHKTARFTVRLEWVRGQEYALLPTDVGPLIEFTKAGEIPDPVRQALAEVARRKAALTDAARQIEDRRKQIAEVSAEQQRLRENMKTVSPNTEYYNRLLKKLDEQETQIERVQKEAAELAKSSDQQRKDLEAYVAGLNVG